MAIPENVHSRILVKVREEWPDDFEMQKHTLDKQVNSYIELGRFYADLEPSDFIDGIFSSALAEWPDDYDMQLHTVTKQLDAAVEFFQYENPHIPKDMLELIRSKAFAEWPDDYDMQLYTLQKQASAWLSLNEKTMTNQNVLPTAAPQPVAATTQTLSEVLAWLCTQNSVPAAVLRQKLLPLGLMPSAVIDEVNERAFDVVGEAALAEAADTVTVQRGVLLQVLAVW